MYNEFLSGKRKMEVNTVVRKNIVSNHDIRYWKVQALSDCILVIDTTTRSRHHSCRRAIEECYLRVGRGELLFSNQQCYRISNNSGWNNSFQLRNGMIRKTRPRELLKFYHIHSQILSFTMKMTPTFPLTKFQDVIRSFPHQLNRNTDQSPESCFSCTVQILTVASRCNQKIFQNKFVNPHLEFVRIILFTTSSKVDMTTWEGIVSLSDIDRYLNLPL